MTRAKKDYSSARLVKIEEIFFFSLLSFFLFSSTLFALEYEGKVVSYPYIDKNQKYTDGDTIEILYQGRIMRFRLANVDAPEMGQSFGYKSKKFLDNLIAGSMVTVVETGLYDGDLPLVRIYMDELHVNAFMIESGFAWYSNEYGEDLELLDLMEEARKLKKGLWSRSDPVSPREWRRIQSEKKAAQELSGAACGKKRRCWEMADCEEAKFYLTSCGVLSLDGDRDGVPCEKICK